MEGKALMSIIGGIPIIFSRAEVPKLLPYNFYYKYNER